MGLVADAVNQVIELGPGDIEPPPSFGTRVDVAYLKGMGRADKRFVLLLDIERVLSSDEAQEVAAVGADSPEPALRDSRRRGPHRGLASARLGSRPRRSPGPRSPSRTTASSSRRPTTRSAASSSTSRRSPAPRRAATGSTPSARSGRCPDQHHQLSFTLPVQQLHASAGVASTGVGDAALNYRYQALGVSGGPVAFAPRVSLLVPTGQHRDGLGTGGAGFQVNLPLSWAMGSRFVSHWNAGATHTFQARDAAGDEAGTNASPSDRAGLARSPQGQPPRRDRVAPRRGGSGPAARRATTPCW